MNQDGIDRLFPDLPSNHMEQLVDAVDSRFRHIEQQIEQNLAKAVKAAGGIAPKFTSPGFAGMPDRLVLMPGGHIGFVEVKAPGEKPRPLQLSRHRLLRRLGFKVYVLDDEGQIGGIMDEIQSP